MKKKRNEELALELEYEALFGTTENKNLPPTETSNEKEMPQTNPRKTKRKKETFLLMIVAFIIGLIIGAILFGRDSNEDERDSLVSIPAETIIATEVETTELTTLQTEMHPTATNPITEPATEEEPVPLERDQSLAELTVLFSGAFFVGEDIPPGRYVITADDSGNLFIRRAGRSFVNAILEGNHGVASVTVDLEIGDEIEISGIDNVTFTPAETEMSTVLTTGFWIVGLDIPSGTFDVITTYADESGNFFVRRNGRSVVNEILGDSQMGVERIRVHLEEGDVIEIVGLNAVTFE